MHGDYQNERRMHSLPYRGTATAIFATATATTTGAYLDCTDANALLIDYDSTAITSGNWVVKVTGAIESDGTYKDVYSNRDGTLAAHSFTITANESRQVILSSGLPAHVKLVGTRTTDGTLSLSAQPITI